MIVRDDARCTDIRSTRTVPHSVPFSFPPPPDAADSFFPPLPRYHPQNILI